MNSDNKWRPASNPQPKRIWMTPQQSETLKYLGFPISKDTVMTFKEAECAIAMQEQLPDYIVEHEVRFHLPEVKAVSAAQAIFARNSRFHYFKNMSAIYGGLKTPREQALFMQALEKVKAVTDAKYWIQKRNASLGNDFNKYLCTLPPAV